MIRAEAIKSGELKQFLDETQLEEYERIEKMIDELLVLYDDGCKAIRFDDKVFSVDKQVKMALITGYRIIGGWKVEEEVVGGPMDRSYQYTFSIK